MVTSECWRVHRGNWSHRYHRDTATTNYTPRSVATSKKPTPIPTPYPLRKNPNPNPIIWIPDPEPNTLPIKNPHILNPITQTPRKYTTSEPDARVHWKTPDAGVGTCACSSGANRLSQADFYKSTTCSCCSTRLLVLVFWFEYKSPGLSFTFVFWFHVTSWGFGV